MKIGLLGVDTLKKNELLRHSTINKLSSQTLLANWKE